VQVAQLCPASSRADQARCGYQEHQYDTAEVERDSLAAQPACLGMSFGETGPVRPLLGAGPGKPPRVEPESRTNGMEHRVGEVYVRGHYTLATTFSRKGYRKKSRNNLRVRRRLHKYVSVLPRAADWKVGDTADSKVCATSSRAQVPAGPPPVISFF